MGLFDGKETNKRIANLEKRLEKILESNTQISLKLNTFNSALSESEKRSPEYEKEARQSSRKTSESNSFIVLLINVKQFRLRVCSSSKYSIHNSLIY